MGFIDWHGNKEDQYEEILEFAKIKEKMEADNFGSQKKKMADAKFFGVPELVSMETTEILKLLYKEKLTLDRLYDVLVKGSLAIDKLQISSDMTEQFYADFLRYSMDALFLNAIVDENKYHQFTETILVKVFKVDNEISTEEHYGWLKTSKEYRQYLSRGFELKSGNATLFWQWIKYLSDLSTKMAEAAQFIKIYQRFMDHLSYYINQLMPNADVGKRYAERKKVNTLVLQHSLSTKIDIAALNSNMSNPIFRIIKEEEERKREREILAKELEEEAIRTAAELEAKRIARERAIREAKIAEAEIQRKVELAEEQARLRAEQLARERELEAEREAERLRKHFISLMKCARIVLGYYILDIEDDSDMITAGRLYTAIKEKYISLDRMISIFPAESIEELKNGSLPIVTCDGVRFELSDREILHYVDYATIYMQGEAEDTFKVSQGTIFITNQRIQIETGAKVYSIPYEYLKKAIMYDLMPELIELAASRENFFVRTADTEQTYSILKMILGYWSGIEEKNRTEPVNMEELSIDFLKKEDMESYIFGIKTMMDTDMPDNLHADLVDMIRSLEYLDVALKKYPSYRERCYNFFSYYIPEAVKILYSYNEYEKAGIEELQINPVYDKVVVAIGKLSVAAKQQVVEIYKDAIVDTTARAQALAEILGQDGYVDPAYLIR